LIRYGPDDNVGMDDHTVTGRVMAVLDAVADLADRASLAAVTRRVGIPKATVRRIAADLVARGMLAREESVYRLGPRLLELGIHAAARDQLRQAATPHVHELFARTGEIAWISAVTDTSHLLLQSAFGLNRAADMRRPWPTRIRSAGFLTTAAGLVLLADRPELTDDLRSRPLPRATPHTTRTWPRYMDAIQAVRDGGVATEHEQSALGYNCVAAGICGADGRVVGVLGVVGRADRLVAQRLTRPVLAAAADIERALR
jgi:DNA-binding IclR family transcriptional regulator